jgi:exopolysaccharide biosynthesis polyprenyl glycosylphosphotransferase
MSRYLGVAVVVDVLCALLAGTVAFEIRYHARVEPPEEYLAFTGILPVLWWASVWLAGGYDARIVGAGAEEYHRIVRAGVSLTAGVAIFSYATKLDLARGYVVLALPCATAFDLLARYVLRKRLHALRRLGSCTLRAVAVGPARAVSELVTLLSRDTSHGLSVVAACLPGGNRRRKEIAGIPVCGDIGSVAATVDRFHADTVAVVSCAEMDGARLRELAWALEKTGTDLCVAPALLDVAGPRTTIRPVAGLPLLHLEHATLSGPKLLLKGAFDRVVAAAALILLVPVLAVLAWAIQRDGGPVLFRHTRIGKDGLPFTLYKFRSMVVDAEARKADLESRNEVNGVLFKIRRDPRLTPLGAWMRLWSVDEIPQLLNVLRGEMSLVGPRPWAALPYEKAARSGEHVPRRLAVKPGITGLWQVSGRADLPWEESVRLDVRYVEHWSLALDLQILWKTTRAVLRRTGAYLPRGRHTWRSRPSGRPGLRPDHRGAGGGVHHGRQRAP